MKRVREQDEYTHAITAPRDRSGETLVEDLWAAVQTRASLFGVTVTCDSDVLWRLGADHMIQQRLLDLALQAFCAGCFRVHFVLNGDEVVYRQQ